MFAGAYGERSVKQAALYSGVNVAVGFNHVDFYMLHVCILSVDENGVLGRPMSFPGEPLLSEKLVRKLAGS
jgi:hypothetical protein